MEQQKTKLLMIDENTLVYQMPGRKIGQVLAVSVLKGSRFRDFDLVLERDLKNARLATKQDFKDMRVCFDGYENSGEYEYQK